MARRRVKKKARRIATFGLISIALIVFIVVTVGGVFFDIVDKYKEKKNLENKLLMLEEKKKELEIDVKKLEDPEYLARYAREEFRYSKPGEYVFVLPEEEK